jgi:hypothetical protein
MAIINRLEDEIEMLKVRVKTLEEVLLAVNAETKAKKEKKSTSKK